MSLFVFKKKKKKKKKKDKGKKRPNSYFQYENPSETRQLPPMFSDFFPARSDDKLPYLIMTRTGLTNSSNMRIW